MVKTNGLEQVLNIKTSLARLGLQRRQVTSERLLGRVPVDSNEASIHPQFRFSVIDSRVPCSVSKRLSVRVEAMPSSRHASDARKYSGTEFLSLVRTSPKFHRIWDLH